MVSILDDNTPDFNDFDFKKKFMKEEKILEDIYSEVEISQEIDNLNEFEKQFPEEIITKSGGKSSKEKYL